MWKINKPQSETPLLSKQMNMENFVRIWWNKICYLSLKNGILLVIKANRLNRFVFGSLKMYAKAISKFCLRRNFINLVWQNYQLGVNTKKNFPIPYSLSFLHLWVKNNFLSVNFLFGAVTLIIKTHFLRNHSP